VILTVSLKDALRERPGTSSYDPASWEKRKGSVLLPGHHYPTVVQAKPKQAPAVVSHDMWTVQEFRTFRALCDMAYSTINDPRSRHDANVYLKRFIEQHTKSKCDMMMAEIRRLDSIAWKGKQS
jgi:hypothetical protein